MIAWKQLLLGLHHDRSHVGGLFQIVELGHLGQLGSTRILAAAGSEDSGGKSGQNDESNVLHCSILLDDERGINSVFQK